MKKRKTSQPLRKGNVVGTIHSRGALEAAKGLFPGDVDFLELRVDAFSQSEADLSLLESTAEPLSDAKIVTVRHPDEGGSDPALTPERREELYRRFLPLADWVDVELRSLGDLPELVAELRERKMLILSHHDFERTPSLEAILALARQAEAAGAQVFKIAARAESPEGLSRLARFLAEWKGEMALSVMGMGPQGKISRLTLGSTGSVFNYGYLDQVQVSGQWPVARLKALLAEIAAA